MPSVLLDADCSRVTLPRTWVLGKAEEQTDWRKDQRQMTEPVYRRVAQLMEAKLGDELVALDPNAGECFGFNSVATSVWRELQEPKSFDQLRDTLLDEYEVEPAQCEQELRELLNDLSAKGLVTTVA
jgi:hypothetical protein